ncbi:MAG: CPC_1213 family protein [Clostridium sp.]
MGNKEVKRDKNRNEGTHNPREESTKAVFGDPKAKGDEFTPRTFK